MTKDPKNIVRTTALRPTSMTNILARIAGASARNPKSDFARDQPGSIPCTWISSGCRPVLCSRKRPPRDSSVA